MRVLSLLTLLLAGLAVNPSAYALEVLTSIKPVQLIVQEITRGVTQPGRLLEPGASPHDYQLRPSDMARLNRADLVFWIGPALELFLQKPFATLPERVRVVALGPLEPAVDADEDEDEEGHHHGAGDPHIWLSPEAALTIAATVSQALQTADPEHAARYRANERAFRQQVVVLDRRIGAQLADLRGRGYFVFHDGYGHFEAHYGLNHLGAFTLSPGRRPGARQLATIRQRLEASAAVCVFSEPQFPPRLIEAITDGLPVRRGELDPLAGGAERYADFLQQLADRFSHCLAPVAENH